MGAAPMTAKESEAPGPPSEEMLQFVNHLAEILAEEFAAALKEERDAGSRVCEVLE